MAISLTKEEALQELQHLKETWKAPPFDYPTFCPELEYVSFFIYLLIKVSGAGANNIVPFVSRHFEQGLDEAFTRICRILDRHRADGSGIYNLMEERKFILRGVKRSYNRKVPGKSPKGLTYDEWESYNNWLAADIMWNGFIEGHDPEFKVSISKEEDIDIPVEDLLCPDYRPLWAMKQAFDKAGRPTSGNELDSVYLRPIGFWVQYMKREKGLSV